MKFEVTYTKEQEDFRNEVREWIRTHAEGVGGGPVDPKEIPKEQFRRTRQVMRELGKKGWFAPHLPKEMGGGGLSPEKALILQEELGELVGWRIGPGYGPPDFQGQDISLGVAGMLLDLGTEEQKQRMLPHILQGEWQVWELFTEPEAGTDLPSLRTTADREGDEYVLNGTKIFVGGSGDPPDFMSIMAITDRNAPRHRNLSMILTPANSKGITIQDLDILADNVKRMVHLEDVRVPVTQIIGREGDGWAAFPGNRRNEAPAFPNVGLMADPYRPIERVIEYCKETKRNGQPLSKNPEVQEALTKAYVDHKILELLRLRNYWIGESKWLRKPVGGRRMGYEGAQVAMYGKTIGPRIASAMLKAMGPAALIANDPWAPLEGAAEFYQRHNIVRLHPGGTVETQKLRTFRGLMGRDLRVSSS